MSDLNDFSLFDYEDSLNIFNSYGGEKEEFDKDLTKEYYTNYRTETVTSKPQIFKVNNYEFLKKKREESLEKSKNKRPWSYDEDAKLKQIVINRPYLSWGEIANYFPYRSRIQCMSRWQKVLQPGLKKGKWSEEEDKILINWVRKNGANKWSKLTTTLNGRSSKQIRDRWVNNLNPDRAKDFSWTNQLDEILLRKYLQYGSSWVQISQFIPNSTENMIKNRFYSMLRSVATRQLKCKFIETASNNKIKTQNEKEFLNFEENNINVCNPFIDNSNCLKGKNKKRENYSLSLLINYLPDLLEEKGIDVNTINNSGNNSNNTGISTVTNSESLLNDDQKKILNNFFSTLSERFPNKDSTYKETNFGNQCLSNDKVSAQFKFKSTILLNLQLRLLQRIFERYKMQIIGKFFQYFKGSNSNVC